MNSDQFSERHLGPRQPEIDLMLDTIGVASVDELVARTIPASILMDNTMNLPGAVDEQNYLAYMKEVASKNKMFLTYMGIGYYNTILPPVIQRNILENPNWYTSYTPYQAEISQGRLEALLNFQTMVMELSGMEIANASLLDEATAAAEAMIMFYNARSRSAVREGKNKFFVDEQVFPQTLAVLITRAEPLGIELEIGSYQDASLDASFFGVLVQYPAADGEIRDYAMFAQSAHEKEIAVAVAADIMSLVLLTPPGEWDADVVVGSTQRFGIPMFYGGPHAAYFACKESFKRHIPGRIIGISIDVNEKPALRMALQTREQHIKRERATSNICTAQALLASMAGMYAAYHGPEGLHRIASNIHTGAAYLASQLQKLGYSLAHKNFFDTLRVVLPGKLLAEDIRKIAEEREINFYYPDETTVQFSTDETTHEEQLNEILEIFSVAIKKGIHFQDDLEPEIAFKQTFARKSPILPQPAFHRYHSETEMMRYIRKLERRDISLTQSMISLGSCTMKLNAAAQLMPVSWPEFASQHPFIPIDQTEGFHQMINELEQALKEITGFETISFQPNSGAAGEYTGLMVIQAYHKERGDSGRNVVLIPASAHGTNPASAVMAGLEVKVVRCDDHGNIDTEHLKELAESHKEVLSSIMITYPSTHGVFEDNICEIIGMVHSCGGQVYMDGANMNAQVG
ncbi:MAG: glycine dehydrogenase (aminomethyl-transferring), partial [Bacteroidetes bacterium]